MGDSPSRRDFLASGISLPAAVRASAANLRFRVLGKTGLKVTGLGFGSETVSDSSVFARALDAGINFFDTARPYQGGNAERALGEALKGRRKDVILSTRSYANSARQAEADLETSLKQLGVDSVDIWYLGQKDKPEEVSGAMLEMQRAAQKAGKFRFRGLSTHRIGAMLDVILKHGFDVVQIPYSFAIGTRRDPFKMEAAGIHEALNRLKAAGIGVVAMKVMAGGYRFASGDSKRTEIHDRPGARGAALRWALRDDRVQSTSVRMTDAEQLEENLKAAAGRYSEADATLLASYTDSIRGVLCRMCGACDGACPKGLPVSDVVRYVMYAESYRRHDLGLAGFLRSGCDVRCGECGRCAVVCPNGVRVRERMESARRLFTLPA